MQGVADYFHKVAEVLPRIPAEPVKEIIRILLDAKAGGRRIYIFGNGGSSANASHIVTDLVKGDPKAGRPYLRVICLSDNTPTLTAYGNDIDYAEVFAGPLEVLAEPGDVAFAISGSGNSPNVLRAMEVAAAKGLTRVGLTGRDGGRLASMCDAVVIVPTQSMQIIEDAHLVILHAVFLGLCEGAVARG